MLNPPVVLLVDVNLIVESNFHDVGHGSRQLLLRHKWVMEVMPTTMV